MLAYLGRLRKRIDDERSPHDDKLRSAMGEAYNTTHSLRVKVHYMRAHSRPDLLARFQASIAFISLMIAGGSNG